MILFFIQFYKVQHIFTESNYSALKDFGFEKGADFSIYLKSISSKSQLSLFMLNKTEKHSLPSIIMNSNPFCNRNTSFKYEYRNAKVENQTLSGTIDEPGVYYPIVVSCDTKLQHTNLNFHIVLSFHNPTTNLDIRQVPLIKILPIFILINTILLALWLYNWYSHKNVHIRLHKFISFTFVTTYLMFLVDWILLLRLNHHDDDLYIQSFAIIFSLIARGMFFSTLLLAAKGYCILKDTIYLKEIAASLIYSFVFMSLEKIVDFVFLGQYGIYVMSIALVFVALFIYELIKSINDASIQIQAHMLVIQNEGIDAASTPIYLKHRMYFFLHKIIVLGCCLVLICMLISSVVDAPEWISTSLQCLSELIIMTAFGCVFRLRDTDSAGYSMVGEANMDSSIEIALDDARYFSLEKEGKQWQEGMDLPKQPTVVSTPAVIVLSSPDGTESLNAEMSPIDIP